jgi:hypothetical protein
MRRFPNKAGLLELLMYRAVRKPACLALLFLSQKEGYSNIITETSRFLNSFYSSSYLLD